MDYNRKLTENLQKLIHSRKNLLSSNTSAHYTKENHSNNTDSGSFVDVDLKNDDKIINLSPAPQNLEISKTSASNTSMARTPPPIESFLAEKLPTTHQSSNRQVGSHSFLFIVGLYFRIATFYY